MLSRTTTSQYAQVRSHDGQARVVVGICSAHPGSRQAIQQAFAGARHTAHSSSSPPLCRNGSVTPRQSSTRAHHRWGRRRAQRGRVSASGTCRARAQAKLPLWQTPHGGRMRGVQEPFGHLHHVFAQTLGAWQLLTRTADARRLGVGHHDVVSAPATFDDAIARDAIRRRVGFHDEAMHAVVFANRMLDWK